MSSQEPNTEKIKERFKFLATIALFFPVLLDALYKVTPAIDGNKMTLMWGTVISVLVLDYILLECIKNWAKPILCRAVNFSIFAMIGSYAVIFFIMGILQTTRQLPVVYEYLYIIAIKGVGYLPIFILVLLIINYFLIVKKD